MKSGDREVVGWRFFPLPLSRTNALTDSLTPVTADGAKVTGVHGLLNVQAGGRDVKVSLRAIEHQDFAAPGRPAPSLKAQLLRERRGKRRRFNPGRNGNFEACANAAIPLAHVE